MSTKNPINRKFAVGLILEVDEPRAYEYETDVGYPWEEQDVADEITSWLEDLGFKVKVVVDEI